MNDETEKVRFHIARKRAFAGALLTYKLYINGDFAGSLKNGKSLDIDVPRSGCYFIDEPWAPEDRNGIIRASDLKDESQIHIEIRRAGGWKTASYNEFFIRKTGMYAKLPSFDYLPYYRACDDDKLFSQLTEQEKVLSRCLEFFCDVSDAADQVLCSENLFEMLEALQTVGAEQYVSVFTSVIEHTFRGIEFPLSEDERLEDDGIMKKLAEANRIVWASEKENGAAEELHKCLVRYITENLLR